MLKNLKSYYSWWKYRNNFADACNYIRCKTIRSLQTKSGVIMVSGFNVGTNLLQINSNKNCNQNIYTTKASFYVDFLT